MSIEKGDKVVTVEAEVGEVTNPDAYGGVHVSFPSGVGYCYHEKKLAKVDDPLRVRVDSEQEARELVEMAEKAGWDISTNFDHWELSQINCVSLEKGHVNTYCTNRDTTCRHGVPFSGRKSQIRKYLSYNSEEENMSDLTHEKIEISMFEGGYKCKHCGIVGFYVDWSEDCPDHPDRTEEDELTHKRGGKRCLVDHGKGCSCIECEFCGEFIRPSGFDDSCPEHPGRQFAEDDDDGEPDMICYTDDVDESAGVDDGEGDVKRRLAKEILSGDTSLAGAATVNKLNLYERAIREHCELSDGVCEWAYSGKINECMDSEVKTYEPGCHDTPDKPTNFPLKMDKFTHCPYCGREIEITTDEGGKFEVGDVVRDTEYREGDPNTVREYFYIQEVRDYDTEFKYAGKSFELREDVVDDLEKVGSFKPDDDALERVNPDCNGSLFLTDDKVLFDPMCRKEVPDEPIILTGYLDDGTARQVLPPNLEATGIVIDFYEIAEVSDVSNLHVDA